MESWEELTKAEQDYETYSDMYKSVHNIRPRWLTIDDFQNSDEVELMFKQLATEAEIMAAHEAKLEKEAIEKFEKSVENLVAHGAGNRETAIRWMMDADEVDGDFEYFCYKNNLPYGYFKQAA